MKRRMLCAGLLIFVLAGQAPAGDEPFKVPFETLKTRHMVVMVKINGKGPYRLIFDTGASFSLINNKIAQETGVTAKSGEKEKGKDIGSALALLGPMPSSSIKTVEMGDLKAENLAVMVMDHPTVALIDKLMGPVQGIVGMTLFGKYKMTIDYQAKEMTFEPNAFTPPDTMKNMMTLLTGPKVKKVIAPAAQWGFSVAKDEKDSKAGVDVNSVLQGSPAEAGGLKEGDRILTLDGRWTDSVADCYQAASYVKAGTTARLLVQRDGREVELMVKVAAGM